MHLAFGALTSVVRLADGRPVPLPAYSTVTVALTGACGTTSRVTVAVRTDGTADAKVTLAAMRFRVVEGATAPSARTSPGMSVATARK